jgi:tetratricopeptide (TPR) repeat protein
MVKRKIRNFILFLDSIIILVLILSQSIFAQNEKGLNTVYNSDESPNTNRTTRAVIIGISNYEDYKPVLQFAHEDAKAFYSYLISSPKAVDSNNIRLRINNKAKFIEIIKDLWWLTKSSNKGDTAIFYFSGHGGKESEILKKGFLICYDSPMPTDIPFCINSINNDLVNSFISNLLEKEVTIWVVIDACKSGSLSYKDFISDNNELLYKFYSCSPNENSFEDKIWSHKNIPDSKGGGVFTFNLILGLLGFADTKPKDGKVSFFELESFLNANVREQTFINDTINQNPYLTTVNKNSYLSTVDTNYLNQLKEKIDLSKISISNTKGIRGESVNIDNDSLFNIYYSDFRNKISMNELIDPYINNALEIFNQIKSVTDSTELIENIKDELITALLDKPSNLFKFYLRGRDLGKYYTNEDFIEADNYLKTAVNLLTPKDIYYKDLKAQQLFFDGVIKKEDSVDLAIKYLNDALNYIDNAPFVYLELGNIYYEIIGDTSKSQDYYIKANMYANKWIYPIQNLGNLNYNRSNYQKAIYYYSKAIKLKTGNLESYLMRGNSYFRLGKYKSAIKDWEMVIKLDSSYEDKLKKSIEEAKKYIK